MVIIHRSIDDEVEEKKLIILILFILDHMIISKIKKIIIIHNRTFSSL